MIKLGVIADDFTGASDAASFLVKSGNKTIFLTDILNNLDCDCDCVVIGLKIRSIDSKEAIDQVAKVMNFYESLGIERIYYKYCSTFDSTPKGNIGPVMDYLMDRTNSKYSILCPSLPINGRIVKDGILYVNGVPLSESALKNHPLNPMWDSYIPNLMKDQSKYPARVCKGEEELNENERCYYVPDYVSDSDGEAIAKKFKSLKLLSGGSGLLEHLIKSSNLKDAKSSFDRDTQKSIILCGSCSEMTHKQVDYFKQQSNYYISIDANKILDKSITVESIYKEVQKNLPYTTLIYSNGCEGKLNKNDTKLQYQAMAVEDFLAELAKLAQVDNFNKIIVAGGETSGAVTMSLGYSAFYVGESVAPGIPWLIPIVDTKKLLILKSGNFGKEDFFVKAIKGSNYEY